jgi:hypothetical protein
MPHVIVQADIPMVRTCEQPVGCMLQTRGHEPDRHAGRGEAVA